MPKVKTTITIEPEQMDALRVMAAESGLEISVLMRYALAEFLRRPTIFLPAGATVSSTNRYIEAHS